MANINTQGPIGEPRKRTYAVDPTLESPVSGFTRGLAVVQGSADNYVQLATAGAQAIGIIEESVIPYVSGAGSGATYDQSGQACSVSLSGECVAQAGAAITASTFVKVGANGQLVPATIPGDEVIGVALTSAAGVNDEFVLFVCRFTLQPVNDVTYIVSAGAIPVAPGTYVVGGAFNQTLTAPTLGQDGTLILVVNKNSTAFTVTTPASTIVDETGTNKDTATFAAEPGALIALKAIHQLWYVLYKTGVTLTEV
jgi:hypothetical protein